MRSHTLLIAAFCMGSCGCEARQEALTPVAGQVFASGQPAEGASVIFVPAAAIDDANVPRPTGRVDAAGAFTLTTHNRGPGAAPGDYIVVVTWYPPDARSNPNAKNKLSARYADPKKTPLRATVKADTTVLEPFKVQ